MAQLQHCPFHATCDSASVQRIELTFVVQRLSDHVSEAVDGDRTFESAEGGEDPQRAICHGGRPASSVCVPEYVLT